MLVDLMLETHIPVDVWLRQDASVVPTAVEILMKRAEK